MPLSFLNPVLLWGALGAVVPLALHLWRRRLSREVKFSDLRFLREIEASRSRSVGVRRYLLLLLRMLIILLIALLAAGPRLAGLSGGGDRVSLLAIVDGSASMQTREGDGNRFDQALDEALTMIGSLGDRGQAQVLVAGARTWPLFDGWLPARLAGEPGREGIGPDDAALDPAAALREAAQWCRRAGNRAREVVLLTDGQAARVDTTVLRDVAAELRAAGVTRIMTRIVGEPAAGGAVLGLEPPLRALVAGERTEVTALVRPGHAEQVYHLEMDGERLVQAVATVGPGDRQTLAFPLVTPAPGLHVCRVTTDGDHLAADDTRAFVLEVPERVEVLIVHGEDPSTAGRGGWRYLAAALAPTDGGLFRVRDIAAPDLRDNDLAVADLVVCVDPGPLGESRLAALTGWLRRGGRALFLLGDPRTTDYLESTLLPALGLDGPVIFRSHDAAGAQGVSLLPGGRALLAGFEAAPLATLAEARWRRYHALPGRRSEILAAFTGGEPALLSLEIEAGRALLLPFNLSADATDLADNPMSLPFWRRLAAHLIGAAAMHAGAMDAGGPLAYAVPPATAAAGLDGAYVLDYSPTPARRTPGTRPEIDRRPLPMRWRGRTPVLDAGLAARAGIYAFVSDGDTLALRAVNVPASESRPNGAGADSLEALLDRAGLDAAVDLSDMEIDRLGDLLAGTDPTLPLVLLIVGLLLLETRLSRRL